METKENEQTALVAAEKKKGEIIGAIVLQGDLSKLTAEDKVRYYREFCQSLDLNPLTMPFNLLKLNGKEVLYANKNCGEQLRKNNGVSVLEITQQIVNGILVVNVKVQDKTGRTDIETGAVPVGKLQGDALANAMMKAVTKAKRRATLSICSVGVMDETELETVPEAEKIAMPVMTGGDIPAEEKTKEPSAPESKAPETKEPEIKFSENFNQQMTDLLEALELTPEKKAKYWAHAAKLVKELGQEKAEKEALDAVAKQYQEFARKKGGTPNA